MGIAALERWLESKWGNSHRIHDIYMQVGAPRRLCSSKCGVPGTVFFFPRAICFDGSKMLPHSNFSLKMGPQRNGDVASYLVLWSICANLTLIEDASLHRLSRDRVKVRHK